MSLSDISYASLGVILKFMRTDPRHIDSLRRTCKSFNQQAVTMGFDKVNKVYLGLSIERIKKDSGVKQGRRQFEKDIIEIKAFIKKKRSDVDPLCKICFEAGISNPNLSQGFSDSEFFTSPNIFDRNWTHASDSEDNHGKEDYPVGSGRKRKVLRRRRRAEPVQDPNESDGSDYIKSDTYDPKCSCKNWFRIAEHSWQVSRISESNRLIETISKAIKRVNSVRKLKIKCWRLDDKALTFLTEQSQFRFLRKIVLLNCNLNIHEKCFHQFLQAVPIRIANLNCKFRNFQLDNKALHNIAKVRIQSVFGKTQFMYPGLTDELLKYWEQKPLVRILFEDLETKFSMAGIISLIEASVARKSMSKYELGTIRMNKNEYRMLLEFMQRNRRLRWNGENTVTKYQTRSISVGKLVSEKQTKAASKTQNKS